MRRNARWLLRLTRVATYMHQQSFSQEELDLPFCRFPLLPKTFEWKCIRGARDYQAQAGFLKKAREEPDLFRHLSRRLLQMATFLSPHRYGEYSRMEVNRFSGGCWLPVG